jgi:hypothetical protein
MTDHDTDPDPFEHPAVAFGMGTVAVVLSVLPALATAAIVTGSSVSPGQLALVAAFFGVPGGIEAASSGRDVQRLGRFAVALNVCWLVSGPAAAGVSVAAGATEPIPAVQVGLVAASYPLAYAVVYRGLLARLPWFG